MSAITKVPISSQLARVLKKCLRRGIVLDARAGAAQTEPKTQQSFATGVVTSPLGPCKKIPSENLVEYVWKKADAWLDKPAAVSFGGEFSDWVFMNEKRLFVAANRCPGAYRLSLVCFRISFDVLSAQQVCCCLFCKTNCNATERSITSTDFYELI